MDDIPMADDLPEAIPQRPFNIVDFIGESSRSIDSYTTFNSAGDVNGMRSEMYEVDESVVLARLARLYPFVDVKKQPLPRHWSTTDRFNTLNISSDLLRVRYKGKGVTHKDAAAVRANRPIPKSTVVYYYEIKIINKGKNGYMGIGFSEKSVNLNRLPGWDATSYGYHGDDGNFFSSSGKGVEYGPTFTTEDIVGCGVNFVTREVFFTKNGKNLGVATSNVLTTADLFPTVGMQTVGEMIDANFGQKPFAYDIESDIRAAEAQTINSIRSVELPPEKAIWMNRTISAWLAHEGYSSALEAFNRTAGLAQTVPSRKISKDVSAPISKASSNVIFENSSNNDNIKCEQSTNQAGISGRRTVVKLVQEAFEEEMDNRRCIIRLVQDGKTHEAMEKVENLYPTLLNSNKQLYLLLKIQQFVEMLVNISKDSTTLMEQQTNGKNGIVSPNWDSHGCTSPLPSSSHTSVSSRQKRSNTDNGVRNAVKRRSSEEDGELRQCSPRRATMHGSRPSGTPNTLESQNGSNNLGLNSVHESEMGEPMEINDAMISNGSTQLLPTNGSCVGSSVLAGTPPTSTTIIEEFEDFSDITDGLPMGNGNPTSAKNGFSKEELQSYEKYLPLLAFGTSISRFANHFCDSVSCLPLRKRMDDAFSLVVHENPKLSPNAYLLEQKQRNIVAKALNSAILEVLGHENSSQLDDYFRKARNLRHTALITSPGSLFADIDKLVFGKEENGSVDENNENS